MKAWEGDTLTMEKVTRHDMGGYYCLASNGVPPSVSKRIKVSVDCEYWLIVVHTRQSRQQLDNRYNIECICIFSVPPILWTSHQLVGIPLGYNVTLECITEAHPTSLNYWTLEKDQMIHDSTKYKWVYSNYCIVDGKAVRHFPFWIIIFNFKYVAMYTVLQLKCKY